MNTVINIRTNTDIRDRAKKVFSEMGLSTSAGINIFLHQVLAEKGLPFTPTSDPKKLRARWDAQVTEALKSKKYLNAKSVLRAEIPTKSELAAIRKGRAAFKQGDYVTLSQLNHELDSRRI